MDLKKWAQAICSFTEKISDLKGVMGYPRDPHSDNYLVYTIKEIDKEQFGNKKWDVRKLPGYSTRFGSARPFSVTLTELSNAIVL